MFMIKIYVCLKKKKKKSIGFLKLLSYIHIIKFSVITGIYLAKTEKYLN